jgi:hypothetical protein
MQVALPPASQNKKISHTSDEEDILKDMGYNPGGRRAL